MTETPPVGIDGKPLPQTTDARLWASKFIENVLHDGAGIPNFGICHVENIEVWFANALQAGFDHGCKCTMKWVSQYCQDETNRLQNNELARKLAVEGK